MRESILFWSAAQTPPRHRRRRSEKGEFRARSSEPPGIDLASFFITSLASWYIAVARRARCQKWVFRGGKKLVKKRLLKLPKKGGRKKERGGLLLPPSLQLLLASVKHALFDEKKEKGPLPICTFFSFFMRRISAERRTVGWRGGGKNQWWPQSSRQRRWDLVRGFMARWAPSPPLPVSEPRTQRPKAQDSTRVGRISLRKPVGLASFLLREEKKVSVYLRLYWQIHGQKKAGRRGRKKGKGEEE